MTDTPPAPPPTPDAIDPERIRDAFTSRELGLWEMTTGASLAEFGSAYLMAMLAWWGAKQDGNLRPPDEFLDMSLTELQPYAERATELLGKLPTGDALPSGMSTASAPASLPSSDISTTSPSPSLPTSPA